MARGNASDPLPDDIRHVPWLMIGAAAIAAAVLLLGVIGLAIDRGSQFSFDRTVLLAMRHGTMHGVALGPAWLKQAMIDVTGLGGPTVLVIVVAVAAGFLATLRHWLTMALVLGGTITGSIAVGVAKELVGRARPALTDHFVEVSSASFPSGHAANSAIIYLTIAALIVQVVEERRARIFILATTALLVTAIGFSRVYLGVHWPSDVLAGWSFGTLWALAWWALGAAVRLRRAGRSILHPGE
jgi:undecaprenyl-diphosphatase